MAEKGSMIEEKLDELSEEVKQLSEKLSKQEKDNEYLRSQNNQFAKDRSKMEEQILKMRQQKIIPELKYEPRKTKIKKSSFGAKKDTDDDRKQEEKEGQIQPGSLKESLEQIVEFKKPKEERRSSFSKAKSIHADDPDFLAKNEQSPCHGCSNKDERIKKLESELAAIQQANEKLVAQLKEKDSQLTDANDKIEAMIEQGVAQTLKKKATNLQFELV